MSLNPLYRGSDLVSDDRLEGRWVDDDGAEWAFRSNPATEDGVGRYQLIYRSDRQDPGTAERGPVPVDAHLLQIGEDRFLDLTVDPKADEHSLYDLHLLPVHSFWRIGIQDDSLTLQSLNAEVLESAADAGHAAASSVEVRNWRVLTASTEDLQALLASFVKKGEGFDEPEVLHRIPDPEE